MAKVKKYFLKRPIPFTAFTLILMAVAGIGLFLLTNEAQAAAGDIKVNFKNEFGNSFTPSSSTIGYWCAGGTEQTTSSNYSTQSSTHPTLKTKNP